MHADYIIYEQKRQIKALRISQEEMAEATFKPKVNKWNKSKMDSTEVSPIRTVVVSDDMHE